MFLRFHTHARNVIRKGLSLYGRDTVSHKQVFTPAISPQRRSLTNTNTVGKTSDRLVTIFLQYYYNPIAMKSTSAVFGILGLLVAEEVQFIDYTESPTKIQIPLGRRLFIDGITVLMFAAAGFYLHMFLPAYLIIFPLCALVPGEDTKECDACNQDLTESNKQVITEDSTEVNK